jgi:hypothetical protein
VDGWIGIHQQHSIEVVFQQMREELLDIFPRAPRYRRLGVCAWTPDMIRRSIHYDGKRVFRNVGWECLISHETKSQGPKGNPLGAAHSVPVQ